MAKVIQTTVTLEIVEFSPDDNLPFFVRRHGEGSIIHPDDKRLNHHVATGYNPYQACIVHEIDGVWYSIRVSDIEEGIKAHHREHLNEHQPIASLRDFYDWNGRHERFKEVVVNAICDLLEDHSGCSFTDEQLSSRLGIDPMVVNYVCGNYLGEYADFDEETGAWMWRGDE